MQSPFFSSPPFQLDMQDAENCYYPDVMAGTSQHCWQHQLAKTAKPTDGRINLIFRRIINKTGHGLNV